MLFIQTSFELTHETIGRSRVEHILIGSFMQRIWNGDKTGITGDLSIEIRNFIKKISVIALVNIRLDWFRRRNAYFFWCKAEVIKLSLALH